MKTAWTIVAEELRRLSERGDDAGEGDGTTGEEESPDGFAEDLKTGRHGKVPGRPHWGGGWDQGKEHPTPATPAQTSNMPPPEKPRTPGALERDKNRDKWAKQKARWDAWKKGGK